MKTSEQINEIATALAKAQGEIKPAPKNSNNPHYRSAYSSIADIWETIRKPLCGNGITVLQDVQTIDKGVSVITRLIHSSGQWVEFGPLCVPMAKQDAQGTGSAISYGKRYALCAAVGVVSGEEDDDGEEACSNHPSEPKRNSNHITSEQLAEFSKVFSYCDKNYQIERLAVLRMAPHNAKTLAEMPKNIYEKELELAKSNARETHEKKLKEKENGQNSNHE
jgi:hypothetical protein